MKILEEIGHKVAEENIKIEHFSENFLIGKIEESPIKRFTQKEYQELEFKKVMKKRTPIECIQIHEPFEVETMEGLMRGKAGDFLMRGVRGELYACDYAIFKETYEEI